MAGPAPKREAQITVLNGPLAGATMEVKDKLTLGRRPENDLRLRDEQVSRFHAVVEQHRGRFYIEDLGSRTGTSINGEPVDEPTALKHRSRIIIGQTVLQFTLEPLPDLSSIPDAPIFAKSISTAHSMPLPRAASTNDGTLTLFQLKDDHALQNLAKEDATGLRRAGEHLQTLLKANSLVSTELDIERLFEKILDALFEAFPAHRAVVMTTDDSNDLVVRATRVKEGMDASSQPQVSNTIAYRALRERVGIHTLDAGSDERFDARKSIVDQNIRSAICAPMIHQERAFGVIYMDTVGITHAFREDDLHLLTGIAGPAAGAIRNATLVSRLKETAIDTIFRLAVAAEYRDDDTGFHIHRMSDYAEAIARSLGYDEEFCEIIRIASPMHDVGKIGIPDSILKKPGRLTSSEFEIMKQHTIKGGAILANANSDLLRMAESIAMTHHEKWAGTGYPRGILRESIPIEGRIVSVADVFDAVMSKRCYKKPFGLEESLKIIKNGAGNHFDPQVVEAFISTQDRILSIRDHYARLEVEAGEDSGPQMVLLQKTPAPPAV